MKTIMIVNILINVIFLHSQVLWEERFTDTESFSESQFAHYKDGVYHIFAKNGRVTSSNKMNITDAAVQIKTEYIGGVVDQGYGFIFRVKDFDNFYVFAISGNGQYFLRKRLNKEYYDVISWTESQDINKNGVNYLAVSCNGPIIDLYINGKKINSATDASLKNGTIGMIAFGGVHAHFDDLIVARSLSDIEKRYDFTPEPVDRTADFPEDPSFIFTDNFDKMNSGWSESENVYYERGFYTLWNQSDMHYTWHNFSQKDYILETNFRINRWLPETYPDKSGIFFRANKTDDFYALSVSKSKTVVLEKRVNNFNSILHEQQIESLDVNGIIRLKVSVIDDEIQCWVNDEWLGKFSDQRSSLMYFNFGYFASKGVQLYVYSIRVGEIQIDWGAAISGFFLSPGFITVSVIIFVIVLIRIAVKAQKKKERTALIQRDILRFIKKKKGSLSITNVMDEFRIDMKTAKRIMEDACQKYQGHHLISQDGNDWYDFPDYFRSSQKD